MYEELVQRLRNKGCQICPICRDAADAIHQLSHHADDWEKIADQWRKRYEEVARHGHKVTHNRPIAGHWVSGELGGGWDGMEGRVWVPPLENNPVDYCSECGKRLDDTFQKYCPNCGVRMDGDAE